MPSLGTSLELDRCPHCQIALPNLPAYGFYVTNNHAANCERSWGIYACQTCGGMVTAFALSRGDEVIEYFPQTAGVDSSVPERPREFLRQAQESLHAPAGAILLAASSVDAMLKAKKYSAGNLYSRIDQAATDNLITVDMAKWAHQVRLEANDQRHADESVDLPNEEDAKRVIEFTSALAQFLFVLPALVSRGLKKKK